MMYKHLLLLFLLVAGATATVLAQASGGITNQTIIQNGVGLGAVIAVVTSWSRNQSVLWAMLHGLMSWIYVIHLVLTRGQYENRN
jgi:hypothetical protein